jgi:hypothetical protein
MLAYLISLYKRLNKGALPLVAKANDERVEVVEQDDGAHAWHEFEVALCGTRVGVGSA